ncbi:DHA2 family efflux MFS transporter permease subunit [Salinisphaera sp. T31B1]|uniref:DHA2 family efflux MFS transporter permease subunit n=1 Tax=Salinisphaera sp. T31B1 TaxID=727963 RepID=UPI003342C49E
MTVTVIMGTVAVVLNATVVNVAIPPIMADFGMSQLAAQWLATGFMAAMTATMLASARIMERLGQRRTFEISIWLFLVACLIAAASPTSGVMIAARILQGATAGIIQPLALVLIFDVFEDNERGKALGLYGMGVVLAPALGPAVGGVLIDWLSWRAIYLPGIPFGLMALWGARRYLSDDRPARVVPFDWLGLALLCASLALLLIGLSELTEATRVAAGLMGTGLVVLVAFIARMARAKSPLIDLAVLAYPRFALASVLAMVYGAGLYGSTYLVPLLAQSVQQFSPSLTGLVMMPAGLALMLIFPISGRLADRMPAHRLILLGCAGFALGIAGVATSGPATGFVVLAGWIAFGRMALGIMMPALNIGGLRSLPDSLTHQGSGMINFTRQLGGAFGVNLFALLLQWRVGAGLEGHVDLQRLFAGAANTPDTLKALTIGFRETLIVLSLLFVLAMVLAVAMGRLHAKFRTNSSGL